MTIWDCRTHVRMTSMTSSVERTDLDFKISVALHTCTHIQQAWQRSWQRGRSVICLQPRDCDIEPMSSQIAFVKIGHDELVSTAILSLRLNQVRQLSLTGKSMCCLY